MRHNLMSPNNLICTFPDRRNGQFKCITTDRMNQRQLQEFSAWPGDVLTQVETRA